MGLNSLIVHDDVPFFWDNWDIMHHTYETQRFDLNTAAHLVGYESSQDEITVSLTFNYKISDKSTLSQEMTFHSEKDNVVFVTSVEWHESRKLLKAYFPLNVRTDFATFEISSGTVRRPIHANTSWD